MHAYDLSNKLWPLRVRFSFALTRTYGPRALGPTPCRAFVCSSQEEAETLMARVPWRLVRRMLPATSFPSFDLPLRSWVVFIARSR